MCGCSRLHSGSSIELQPGACGGIDRSTMGGSCGYMQLQAQRSTPLFRQSSAPPYATGFLPTHASGSTLPEHGSVLSHASGTADLPVFHAAT